jgi:NADH-quinone oxidoreductase subunit E
MMYVSEIFSQARRVDPDQLIPLLQETQGQEGHVSRKAMTNLAATLDIPVSRVYGVATFYNQFRFAPLGEHVIEVCRGTACHVKESFALAQHLKRRLKLREDGNSSDGRFSVVSVACLGACSIAQVIKIDGEFYGHLAVETLDKLLDALMAEDRSREAANSGPRGGGPDQGARGGRAGDGAETVRVKA